MAASSKMKVKKGDTVQVLAGKDRGKQGRVIDAHPREGKVLVENLNVARRHTKPKPMRDTSLLLLALGYRFIYDVFGCWLTARLAPKAPMGMPLPSARSGPCSRSSARSRCGISGRTGIRSCSRPARSRAHGSAASFTPSRARHKLCASCTVSSR